MNFLYSSMFYLSLHIIILQALAKYERVTVPKFLKEDDTEDAKDAAPLKVALEEEALQQQQEKSAAPVGGMNDPAILRAQLKDCRNQVGDSTDLGSIIVF